jgi:hypothetical protein
MSDSQSSSELCRPGAVEVVDLLARGDVSRLDLIEAADPSLPTLRLDRAPGVAGR